MKADFVRVLCCPARECSSGGLTVRADVMVVVEYRDGAVEEVKEGAIECGACGRTYPISGYVPSFEGLFPEELLEEAQFWSGWYGFMWDEGRLGYFDLRAPIAPQIVQGIEVLDPSTLDRVDLGGSHSVLADHPLIRDAEWVLDVGCGTGWSSLFLARRGHKVVGFDPSVENMRLAKRYAISQGEYIEYLGAGMGFLGFQPDTFDAIFALHSIHHVPELAREMEIAREWLRHGGGIAVDEHIRNNSIMEALVGRMQAWAEKEVFPQKRTLDVEELQRRLPQAAHSTLEGSGSGDVIKAIVNNFVVESVSARYVSLDGFSFIYYLYRNLDVQAYHTSANVLHQIYRFFQEAFPESAEYVSIVGRRDDGVLVEPNEVAEEAIRLSKVRSAYADPATMEARLNEVESRIEEMRGDLRARGEYVEELERTVAVKNEHIGRLERMVHEQEGVLRSPAVRVASRVVDGLKAVRRRGTRR